jgi:hypothetical protein
MKILGVIILALLFSACGKKSTLEIFCDRVPAYVEWVNNKMTLQSTPEDLIKIMGAPDSTGTTVVTASLVTESYSYNISGCQVYTFNFENGLYTSSQTTF